MTHTYYALVAPRKCTQKLDYIYHRTWLVSTTNCIQLESCCMGNLQKRHHHRITPVGSKILHRCPRAIIAARSVIVFQTTCRIIPQKMLDLSLHVARVISRGAHCPVDIIQSRGIQTSSQYFGVNAVFRGLVGGRWKKRGKLLLGLCNYFEGVVSFNSRGT